MLISLPDILTSEDVEPEYVVKGLVYQGQTLCFAGEPGVGKSFLMYNMSMSIACGVDFLGMPVKLGSVLYFDEENGRPDLAQYLRWVWRGLREPYIDGLAERLHIEHFALMSKGAKRFSYMAKRAEELRPALIVIDTASPVCAIADENDNAEAGRVISKR
jgi:RecA-family ATPase